MVTPLEILFWTLLAVPVYAYLGFPLLLVGLRVVLARPVRQGAIEPSVSLLVPAYGEGELLRRKVANCLELDYPSGKLQIVIACDGDKNNTPAIARKAAEGTPVVVVAHPVNRGKIGNLNHTFPLLSGEIVVFSDASAMLAPDSLRLIVRNFADPEVGAVSGRYTVVEPDAVRIGRSEDLYWRYETMLKEYEASIHSMLGGHGQLHAIRRELYPYPESGSINDDYIIPYSVLGKGYRAVYEPDAVVWEEAREMAGFQRRVRIQAGNIQQLSWMGSLFWPLRFWPLFFTLSHKVSRLAVPFAMISALCLNLLLLGESVYRLTLGLQLAFYSLAALGAVVRLRPKALTLPYYFLMINLAAFFGLYHALTSRRSMAWK
jgi:cellulose synthase/poly-beta-1,6-N-acetylglucosamine synthase-like glycosyltransferase